MMIPSAHYDLHTICTRKKRGYTMKETIFEELEAANELIEEFGENLFAMLPRLGLNDDDAATTVCAVLADFAELRNKMRALTAVLYSAE